MSFVGRAAAAAYAAAASVSASMPLSVAAVAASTHSISSPTSTAATSVRYKSLKLLNMVSVDEIQDPDLKEEIAEEVRKYGQLLDIQFYVDNSNNSATVALRYATEEDTLRAYQALQDRAFANKKIVASLAP
jgi:hypothetical protein